MVRKAEIAESSVVFVESVVNTFTPQHIDAYQAVLAYEAQRSGLTNGAPEVEQAFYNRTGGSPGKSALLQRLAQGLRPLFAPPPLAYSFPWYEVIEGQGPWEVVLEGSTVDELLADAKSQSEWMGVADPSVLISQHFWRVVEKIDDTNVDLSLKSWSERGFLWRLSLDAIPAKDSSSTILSWHNPSLEKITTYDQLIAEQRWHVMKNLDSMRLAMDPKLADKLLVEARAKDAENSSRVGIQGWSSKFQEDAAVLAIDTARRKVADRILDGLTIFPDEDEITGLVAESIKRYLNNNNESGLRYYSVDEDGQTLILHTWRLHRMTPLEAPDNVYIEIPQASKGN